MSGTSANFQGADVGGLAKVVREFQSAAQKTQQTITFVRALIVALNAASFFTGGASRAYAEYLRTVVLPWLQKILYALQTAIAVLSRQIGDQETASSLATLGIDALGGYRTPTLPSGDTRDYPRFELPVGTGAGGGADGFGPGGLAVAGPNGPAGGAGVAPAAGIGGFVTPAVAGPNGGGGSFGGGGPVGWSGGLTATSGGAVHLGPTPTFSTGSAGVSTGGGGGGAGSFGAGPVAAGGMPGVVGSGSGGAGWSDGSVGAAAGGGSTGGGATGAFGAAGVGSEGSPAGDGSGSGSFGGGTGTSIGGSTGGLSDGDPAVPGRHPLTSDTGSSWAGRGTVGGGGADAPPLGDLAASGGPAVAGIAGAAGLGLLGAGALGLAKHRGSLQDLDGEAIFGESGASDGAGTSEGTARAGGDRP